MATWLDDHEVADGWQLAPTFVAAGLDSDSMERVAAAVGQEALGPVLAYLGSSLAINELVRKVENSAGRISTQVKAVKDYSYMDQTPLQEVDLHQGLENTLTIMGHKLKKGSVRFERRYDTAIGHAIDSSLIAGDWQAMLLGAALAVLSAICALLTLGKAEGMKAAAHQGPDTAVSWQRHPLLRVPGTAVPSRRVLGRRTESAAPGDVRDGRSIRRILVALQRQPRCRGHLECLVIHATALPRWRGAVGSSMLPEDHHHAGTPPMRRGTQDLIRRLMRPRGAASERSGTATGLLDLVAGRSVCRGSRSHSSSS